MSLDPADTIEPTGTLDFIAGWLASDPARLTPSLLDYVGHPPTDRNSSARTWADAGDQERRGSQPTRP